MAENVVIIGAGHAAAQLVASLVQARFEGAITLIGEERHLPYQRPPLSKKFLTGDVGLDQLHVKPPAFYASAGVSMHLGRRAVEIDRDRRKVLTDDGAAVSYSKLVLATGSMSRTLTVPGRELDGVLRLRTLEDAHEIRRRMTGASPGRLVVVGGGYIGLELAASAIERGMDVTILEQADRLIARGVGTVTSRFFERIHRGKGATVHTNVAVVGFDGKERVERVLCTGSTYEADIVVVGVGARPNDLLARAAGLAIDDGIVVDGHCRTEDPDIFAIGDCTSQMQPVIDRRRRLQSVHNALQHAKTAAASICGRTPPSVETPWFWSDQYDVKLQVAGFSADGDEAVVRGNPAEGSSFAVFHLSEGRIVGVDAVNRVPEFMVSRQLIARRTKIDPVRLGDEAASIRSFQL